MNSYNDNQNVYIIPPNDTYGQTYHPNYNNSNNNLPPPFNNLNNAPYSNPPPYNDYPYSNNPYNNAPAYQNNQNNGPAYQNNAPNGAYPNISAAIAKNYSTEGQNIPPSSSNNLNNPYP